MSRFISLLKVLALLCLFCSLGGHSQAQGVSPSIPGVIFEDETDHYSFFGTWTWDGLQYNAQWNNGAKATLNVEKFDASGVIITRTDKTGASAGLTARYTGIPKNNRIVNGTVTWTWPGVANYPSTGTWNGSWIGISEIDTPTFVNGLHTFVSTDKITLKVNLGPGAAGVQVFWTVLATGAATGIDGFPVYELHTADAQGISTFSFIPDNNSAFVESRNHLWVNGSNLLPNPAIGFNVIASGIMNGQSFVLPLSQSFNGALIQDETDTLRQEYIDYGHVYNGYNVPDRSKVVRSLGTVYNSGNYSVQVSQNIPEMLDAIRASYQSQTVTVAGVTYKLNESTAIPTSAFRCPQHNKGVQGAALSPPSKHTLGRAIDITPGSVLVNRKIISVPMTVLYPILLRAALTTPGIQDAWVEFRDAPGKPQKGKDAASDPRVYHVHAQW